MKDSDILQPFILEQANIRGYIVNLTSTYQSIIKQRPYPSQIKKLLGEAMLSCLFLAANMKFEGKLSLQFQGDKRLPLLIVQCDNKLNLRAMAKYEELSNPEDYNLAFINGALSLTLNTPHQENAYQSIVPINSSSMRENLMHYLTQSEQITNQIWLATSEQQVAGIMLQLMPDKNTQQQEEFWEYAVAMGQTLQNQELLTLDYQVLLHRLYHETKIRIFESRPVQVTCNCSEDKMKNILLMVGEIETKQLLKKQRQVKINCDFCNRYYQFDAIDIAALFNPKSIKHSDYLNSNIAIIKEIKEIK